MHIGTQLENSPLRKGDFIVSSSMGEKVGSECLWGNLCAVMVILQLTNILIGFTYFSCFSMEKIVQTEESMLNCKYSFNYSAA